MGSPPLLPPALASGVVSSAAKWLQKPRGWPGSRPKPADTHQLPGRAIAPLSLESPVVWSFLVLSRLMQPPACLFYITLFLGEENPFGVSPDPTRGICLIYGLEKYSGL